ncbi:MAG: MerR family transcriptional regulator [Acidobacteriota bacterium]|jgi:DNA-binding transcriptional MerR regulator|nr:MerR family transcriptional regulator [Acidobacteriota bacterium]
MTFVPTKLYYKIREVCDIAGVEAHVLRFWETEFPALTPPKSRSGQRTYRPKDIELILSICKLLYEDGYTIAGARRKLGMRDPVVVVKKRPTEPLVPSATSGQKPPKKQPSHRADVQIATPSVAADTVEIRTTEKASTESPDEDCFEESSPKSKYASLPLFPDLESDESDESEDGWPEAEDEEDGKVEQEQVAQPAATSPGAPAVGAEKAIAQHPTSARLKRVQTELENILTLLGRE